MFLFYIKNFLALIAGADSQTFKYAEAGRKSWGGIGLNVLMAGLMAGASMASFVILFGFKWPLMWLWTGLFLMTAMMVSMRLALRFFVPNLNKPILYVGLFLTILIISFVLAAPLEAVLVTVAEPGYQWEVKPLYAQIISWVLMSNGENALIALRVALRICSFIIIALPFFVAWSARRGTYAQLQNARVELDRIMTIK